MTIKLKASLDNKEHEVQFRVGGETVTAEVDGRRYEVVVREPAPGVLLFRLGNRVYECRVGTSTNLRDAVEVALKGRNYSVAIIDPKRLRSGGNSGKQHHGSVEIIAPMPGKVVRVLVEKGAEVTAGMGILVVEAMKMQNEMKTPQAGVVVALHANAGDTVNAGDVLALVE